MRNKRYIKWLGLIVAAGLFSGCFVDFLRKENTDILLEGDKEWFVYKIEVKKPFDKEIQASYPMILEPKKGDSSMSFDVDEGRIFGIGSCNNYFATFKLRSDKLRISNVGYSRRMCHPQENMGYERAFFANLKGEFNIKQITNDENIRELWLDGEKATFYLR